MNVYLKLQIIKITSINKFFMGQVYRFRVTYISDYDSTVNIIEEHKMILDAIKEAIVN